MQGIKNQNDQYRGELHQLEAMYRNEVEEHDETREQLHMCVEQMRQKHVEHSTNNETLALRISDCMQRLLATEEARVNVENKNALLQHDLARARQEIQEKEEEAAQVCQSLKAINEQLIQSMEDERKEAQRRLEEALADAESARTETKAAQKEAQTAAEMQAATVKEAEETAVRSHAVAMETDKGLELLQDELQELRAKNRELALKGSLAAEERERTQREIASQLASLQAAQAGRDDLAAKCQEQECLMIEMRGKTSLLQHKLGLLQQDAEELRELRSRVPILQDAFEQARGEEEEARQKLNAATQLAEEFMEQAESGEHELQQAQEAVRKLEHDVQMLRDKQAKQEEESRRASTLALQQAQDKADQDKTHLELVALCQDREHQLVAATAAHAEKERQMEEALTAFQQLEVRVTDDKEEMTERAKHLSVLLAGAEEKIRGFELRQRDIDIELQHAQEQVQEGLGWRDEAEALRHELLVSQQAQEQAANALLQSEEMKSSVIHMVNGLLAPASAALASRSPPPRSPPAPSPDTILPASRATFLRAPASGATGSGRGGVVGQSDDLVCGLDSMPGPRRVGGAGSGAGVGAGSAGWQQENVQREVVEELRDVLLLLRGDIHATTSSSEGARRLTKDRTGDAVGQEGREGGREGTDAAGGSSRSVARARAGAHAQGGVGNMGASEVRGGGAIGGTGRAYGGRGDGDSTSGGGGGDGRGESERLSVPSALEEEMQEVSRCPNIRNMR